ncbi:tetratricopeptide repeat protein [Schlesneria paludicola]|uniref:tetratricopeptide repeat protein n=1 Tax=Schlesneria paludicola TaxID=360056 RepID=UPI0002F49CBF|nr:tetratricopeptide repeat protein [Schlesneria paludicola]
MVRITRLNVCLAALLVSFIVSGCQSNKSMMAWKERSKPKPKFQGLEGPDEVAYWPYKVDKSGKKTTPMPDQIKDKLAKKSEIEKRDSQLSDLMKEGDQLSANGQFEDARLVYMRALMASPGNAAVHHRLAVVADKQHQYSAADEHYQAALRSRPRDVNILSDLGYSYTLRGSLSQAEQTLKQALEIDRQHRRAMANMGLVYAKQNRRDDALAMFREGATEAEAQQFMASIFSQNYGEPEVAASGPRRTRDRKGMTFEQIQDEMAREAQDAKRKRYEADQKELAQARNSQQLDEEWSEQPAPRRVASTHRGDPNQNPSGAFASNGESQSDAFAHHDTQNRDGQRQNLAGVTLYPSTNDPGAGVTPHDPSFVGQTPAAGAQPFTIERGRSSLAQNPRSRSLDPLVQQTRGQQSMMGARSSLGGDSASQLATQLGMSVGPGSLFPVMDGAVGESPTQYANPSTANPAFTNPAVTAPPMGIPAAAVPAAPNGSMAVPAHSYDTRFGGEFQQAQSYQSSNRFGDNQIQQTANRSFSTTSQAEKTEAGPAIAPASPTSNWGSPSDWQGGSGELPSWANQQPTTGSAGTGQDSAVGQSAWAQNSDRRVNTLDSADFSNQANSRDQFSSDTTRPYSGNWPANANSLPNRQPSNVIINGRSSNGLDAQNQFGTPTNQAGSMPPTGSTGSVPQWPYTPK